MKWVTASFLFLKFLFLKFDKVSNNISSSLSVLIYDHYHGIDALYDYDGDDVDNHNNYANNMDHDNDLANNIYIYIYCNCSLLK